MGQSTKSLRDSPLRGDLGGDLISSTHSARTLARCIDTVINLD